MDIIYLIILVFAASFIELWAGIPLGLAFQLNPLLTGTVAALGSISAALIVSFLGEEAREKFIKWRYKDRDLKKGNFYKIWNKYGVIGLGLLSPLLFGALLGAALGIVFGAERKKLLIWMSIGIIIWSILLTAGVYLGLMKFQSWFNINI